MAFSGIVVELYVVDILYYTLFGDNWGIEKFNLKSIMHIFFIKYQRNNYI